MEREEGSASVKGEYSDNDDDEERYAPLENKGNYISPVYTLLSYFVVS